MQVTHIQSVAYTQVIKIFSLNPIPSTLFPSHIVDPATNGDKSNRHGLLLAAIGLIQYSRYNITLSPY